MGEVHTRLISELAKLLLEICGVFGVIGGAVVLLRWRAGRHHIEALPVAAGVLAVLTVAFMLANLRSAGSVLNQARRHAVEARVGLEHCLDETNGEQGSQLPARQPFVNWAKTRLPAHAVYTLAPYTGPPDAWCVALVLLPSLPAGPGGHAGWTIAFGTIPPDVEARIARHDPSVRVFAPGFAIAQDSTR